MTEQDVDGFIHDKLSRYDIIFTQSNLHTARRELMFNITA